MLGSEVVMAAAVLVVEASCTLVPVACGGNCVVDNIAAGVLTSLVYACCVCGRERGERGGERKGRQGS